MITIENVYKSYEGKEKVLDNVSLTIEKGEFVVLLGPSGCGKTTLLKSINKMHAIDSGRISVMDQSIEEWDTIKLRRNVGYVIQQIGLFPHMTVRENIAYVLQLEKVAKEEQEKRCIELMSMMQLPLELLDRYPQALSGGQRQRVGVARALANDSEIILMDEPFGAVDEIARTSLQDELKALQQGLGKTIVFVTHDIEEAFKLASKIVFLNDGKIEQVGTPKELLFKPKSDMVKQFIGMKGFKSILDDEKLEKVFQGIVNGHFTLDDAYLKIASGY